MYNINFGDHLNLIMKLLVLLVLFVSHRKQRLILRWKVKELKMIKFQLEREAEKEQKNKGKIKSKQKMKRKTDKFKFIEST